MEHYDLDLTQSAFEKVRGDLTLFGCWFGQKLRPCLVVIPTVSSSPKPLVITIDTAWKWNPDDPDVSIADNAQLVMRFLAMNGMDYSNPMTHMRVISLVHDHLGDLLRMPAKPLNTVVVADAIRTDRDTGKTTHQEIIKRV